MNKVSLVGRLTKDPKLGYTTNSVAEVAKITNVVGKPFSNQKGDQDGHFINCVTLKQKI
ncbi:single-stranded DNA-binding protein [Alkalibacillus haloalkaliphilus]|uniref:single-stranded DNA-binding protein n=1 Tax=Alkalibacillus haloalkaliphilus TaxID=94136 RepID=UPI0034E01D0E